MKLLLDENLPKKLKADFPEHEIYTVSNKGWNSKKNGEFLKLMVAESFDALIHVRSKPAIPTELHEVPDRGRRPHRGGYYLSYVEEASPSDSSGFTSGFADGAECDHD